MIKSAQKDPAKPLTPQQLVCGTHIIGYVAIDSCDNFFIFGSFHAGPDYDGYRHLFNDLRICQQQMDQYFSSDDDDKYNLACDAWTDSLERINDLHLTLRSSDDSDVQPIRDFQIDEHDRVEFKFAVVHQKTVG